MHTFMIWTIVALHLLGAISTIAMVGKKREPISPTAAVVTTLVSFLVIAGVLAFLQ